MYNGPQMPRILAVLTALAFSLPLYPQTATEAMVPMRDRVKLATSVYLPEGLGPWPAVLTRTPYGKDQGDPAKREAEYAARGYVRVLQDCRGRFKSEGEYRPFWDDMDDGYDTVEWIASQKWSNGKVCMVGGSAMGITANLAAMSGAPHLVCGFVTVAHGSDYRYAAFPGGLFLQNLNEEWRRRQGIPPPDVPRPINRVYDDGYRKRDMRNYLAKINVPFYNVGGWYDIFLQGDIDSFIDLQTQGGPKARGNQKLVMGPFGHGPLSGDLKYPANSANRADSDRMRWFDYWLKGVDNGIMKEPAVRYYVMGDPLDPNAPGNEWRTAPTWPPPAKSTAFYLHAGHKLSTAAPEPDGGKDSYTYDPRNPVPTAGGNNLMMARGPMDQRAVSDRPDVLTFETERLAAPIQVAGPIVAELNVSTDAEDTDYIVKLIDVYPSGYQALVHDEGFRMRYHDGFLKPTRIEKSKIYAIKVDLWSTALVFNKGHKIAIHISSSNAPRFEPNSNTWEPVKSYDQSMKALNTVYHNAKYPSRVVLPVTSQ